MNSYVATVQLLVWANSAEEASDGIGETLRATNSEFLQDWTYLQLGAQWLYPTEFCDCDPDDYEEGDFVRG